MPRESQPALQQGHSDAVVSRAVYKDFPLRKRIVGHQEYLWLRSIGERAAVHVLAATDSGYVMTALDPVEITPHLPGAVLHKLRSLIWCRDDCIGAAGVDNADWAVRAESIFGITVPRWIEDEAGAVVCASHGDPTFSNVMLLDGSIRFIDPCHRVYTPETWGVDAGKVLQSMLGWETVQAGQEPTAWVLNNDEVWQDSKNLRTALWWAGFHCLRINHREKDSAKRPEVLEWSEHMVDTIWMALS